MPCKCSAEKCKEKQLGLSSRFSCNMCNKVFCPDHRHYESHNCKEYYEQNKSNQLFTGEMEKYLVMHNMNKLFHEIAKDNKVK